MERLIPLLGLVIPETSTVFGLKILIAGICGVVAGMFLMASGIDGMILRGGLMSACGAALIGLSARSLIRAERRREAQLIEQQSRQQGEIRRSEEKARCDQAQKLREEACAGHEWYLDDQALNYNVISWRCSKCGANKDSVL